MARYRILFHVGGPAFHPVGEQAARVAAWLGKDYECRCVEGRAAFERLGDCDLFVPMGLHWTGQRDAYRPPYAADREALERYVASGRPLLVHHGAIASYDDWPRFGELLGFTWVWGTTAHSPVAEHRVEVLPTGHPLVRGVENFTLTDELYYEIRPSPGLAPQVHAEAAWQERRLPMIFSAEGGRAPGAGRVVYLANGHDLRAFECPGLRKVWLNAVRWLLELN
ncbi:MAG: ThuA domain-containing protein [Planctomycetota bacterium]|nr:ThuA domain-containing protein [Planctomycetota bacterium]